MDFGNAYSRPTCKHSVCWISWFLFVFLGVVSSATYCSPDDDSIGIFFKDGFR